MTKRVMILATDGFEQSELMKPKANLENAGFETTVVSLEKGEIKGWDQKDWGESVTVEKTVDEIADCSDYDALLLPGDASHILDPLSGSLAQPLWSSVSVEADTAALADALSTAMCLMPREEIEGLRVEGLRKVRLVDRAGDMVTL